VASIYRDTDSLMAEAQMELETTPR